MACTLSSLGTIEKSAQFSQIEGESAHILDVCTNTINGSIVPTLEAGWLSMPFTTGFPAAPLVPAPIPFSNEFSGGWAAHPSFVANTATGAFDIVTAGRYKVISNVSVATGNVIGPTTFQVQLKYTHPTGGMQTYTMRTKQLTAPVFGPLSFVTLGGSVVLDLPAGVSLTLEILHNSSAPEFVSSPITGFAIFMPDEYFTYFQIVKLQ